MNEPDEFSELRNIPVKDKNYGMLPPGGSEAPSSDVDREERYQDMKWKDRYAQHVLCITYGWLGFLVLILLLNGILAAYGLSFLSDAVLITLISATSLSSILSLCCIILKYLFNKK